MNEFEIPRQVKMPKFPIKGGRTLVLIVLVLVLLSTSFYTIGPEEKGIVMRFGEVVRITDPGLHFKLPFGIERQRKVPVERQLKEEFGFRTTQAGVKTQFAAKGRYQGESLMLTGDLNTAVVEWVVQYRIDDPYKYLFKVRDVTNTFRAMTEAVVREVVGDRTVNEVLTIGRTEVAAEVELNLQVLCDQYDTGIKVDQVVLQDVNPPDAVKPSFNAVNEAQQEKEKLINQAQSEYNKVIPRAKGEALQTIQQAQGYALDRLNRARGDSARFVAVFDAYQQAPEVTRKRLYLEMMQEVLPQVADKIIIDSDLKNVLPLLNLNTGQDGN